MQVDAGADVVQLFDSVGSATSGPTTIAASFCRILRRSSRRFKPGVPVIHFGTVTGNLLELMREAGGDVIGLDWRVNLGEAWARLGYDVAVQGNLDPIALFADVAEIRRARAQSSIRPAAAPDTFSISATASFPRLRSIMRSRWSMRFTR